jgi:HMG (high mobility group) box
MDQKKSSNAEKTTASPPPPHGKSSDNDKIKNKRKKQSPTTPWKKPPGFPKRYLSAYNLFFKQERERLLTSKPKSEEGGTDLDFPSTPVLPDPNATKRTGPRKHARSSGIGFANLARIVAKKWKNLDPAVKAPFEEVAMRDKERYKQDMVVWRAQQETKKETAGTNGENGGVDAPWTSTQQGGPKSASCVEAANNATPLERGTGTATATQHDTHYGEEHYQLGPPSLQATLHPTRSFPPPPGHIARSPVHSWARYSSPPAPHSTITANEAATEGSPRYCDRQTGNDFSPSPPHGGRLDEDFYQYTRWGAYDRYPYDPYDHNYYYPPYHMPYSPVGLPMQGMHYRGADGAYPMPIMRQRPTPSSGRPFRGLASAGSYDMYYATWPPPPPGQPFLATSAPHDHNPQPHRRSTSKHAQSYSDHSSDKYHVSPPYNGFAARELHNTVPEETWQRPASRDHFETVHGVVADESERKQIAKAPSASDSQPLALRNEDGSVSESAETNLDNYTVDFLTTLELE